MRPDRTDLRPKRQERPDFRSCRPNSILERPNLMPEMPDLKPERPDLRPERPNWGTIEWADGQTDGRTNKQKSPCVQQDFLLLQGRGPKTKRN